MSASLEMDSYLNISPNMSYGVLECDNCYVTLLQAYDFVIKDLYVVKRGIICGRLCIVSSQIN